MQGLRISAPEVEFSDGSGRPRCPECGSRNAVRLNRTPFRTAHRKSNTTAILNRSSGPKRPIESSMRSPDFVNDFQTRDTSLSLSLASGANRFLFSIWPNDPQPPNTKAE